MLEGSVVLDDKPIIDPISTMDVDELPNTCEALIEKIVVWPVDASCVDSDEVDWDGENPEGDIDPSCDADADSIRVSGEERKNREIPEDDTTSMTSEDVVCSTVAKESNILELADELLSVIVGLSEERKNVLVEPIDVTHSICCNVSEDATEVI